MNLAIFGGSFDPVHSAHLEVARAAASAFRLDRVLFVPAAVSPFKVGATTTPYHHRFRMVELAIEGDRRFEASDLEAGTVRSYSIDTVVRVHDQAGQGVRLFFIIGADAFAEIRAWHRWEDLAAKVEFIVVSRPGCHYEVPAEARVHQLDTLHLDISSSQVRRDFAVAGRTPDVPGSVRTYIKEHGLYSSGS